MTLCEAFKSDDGRTEIEFEKLRFELAWQHFDFHARQRTTMFHFFILLTPFLFGGCFILFKERELVGAGPSIVAAFAGAILAFMFYLLDRRNKQLYSVSEDALCILERDVFFTPFRQLKLHGMDYPGVFNKEDELYGRKCFLKHSMLMGIVYWITIFGFGILALYFISIRYAGAPLVKLPSQITATKEQVGSH